MEVGTMWYRFGVDVLMLKARGHSDRQAGQLLAQGTMQRTHHSARDLFEMLGMG